MRYTLNKTVRLQVVECVHYKKSVISPGILVIQFDHCNSDASQLDMFITEALDTCHS